MATLSFEGSVYFATAVDRRELVVIAPSYTVDVTMNRIQTAIAAADEHEINFTDLPGNKASGLLLSVSEGDIDVTLTDNDSVASTYNLTTSGMIVIMNSLITDIVILANEDSVYDMIVTGTTPVGD
jgi:hypothetical protein